MLQTLRCLKLIMAVAVFSMSLQSQAGVMFFKGTALSIEKLKAAGIAGIKPIRDASGKVLYQLVDDGGKVLSTFVYDKASKEVLKQFKPSVLQETLARGKAGAAITGRKLMHFPAEALTFFIALGAVQAYHLVLHYNENPAAFDTHLSSQKNPVGHLGFAAFMVANGLATEPLQTMIETKSARFLLPHLGMSMGMVASNIVHEVGSLPHMGACMTNMMGTDVVEKQSEMKTQKIAMKNCDLAFEEFLQINWSEKGHEWAPSLFSLSASTVITMMAEATIQKMGLFVAQTALIKVAAFDLALLFTPGGWTIKGATLAYKIVNIAATTVLQESLDAPLRFWWVNHVDLGPALADSNLKLGQWFAFKALNGWAPTNMDGEFTHELEEFKERMYRWRQSNMDSVLSSHSEWQTFLEGLSSEYRVSRKFYMDFTTDLWSKIYQPAPGYTHLMDRKLPLYGVTAQGFDMTKDEDAARLLLAPGKIQDGQMQTVANLNAWIAKHSKIIENYIAQMNPDEQKTTREIIQNLASNNPELVGKAISQMKYSVDVQVLRESLTKPYLDLCTLALKGLGGQASPLMAPGQGYLRILAKDPNNPIYQYDPLFDPLKEMPVTERLIMPMLLGPDVEKGERTIQKNMAGFSASFKPPMIRYAGDYRMSLATLDPQTSQETKSSDVFNQNFWVNMDIQWKGKQWRGGGSLFDFLRQGGVRPSVLGSKESGVLINQFWTKYPERELIAAFNDYQNRYEDIVTKMFRVLNRKDRDFFNAGPIPNGIFDALETEYNVYLAILDSQLTAAAGYVPAELPTTKVQPMQYFKRATNEYVLLDITKAQLAKTRNAWTANLKNEWAKTRAMIEKIKEAQVPAKDGQKLSLVSHVTNKEFENHLNAMDKIVEGYPLYTKPVASQEQATESEDASDDSQEAVGPDQQPNPVFLAYKARMDQSQAETIQFTIEALKSTQREMLDYLQIINAVSYIDNFKGEALTQPMRQHCVMSFDKKETSETRTNKGCYENPNRSIYIGR